MPPTEITAEIVVDDDTDGADPVWMVDVHLGPDHSYILDGSWESVGAAVDAALKWAGDRAYTLGPGGVGMRFVPLEDIAPKGSK